MQVEPFPDSRNRRPIREIEEFPSRRSLHSLYHIQVRRQPSHHHKHSFSLSSRNFLYVYPQSLDFRSVSRRNIGVKVQFLKGEGEGVLVMVGGLYTYLNVV